jgi:hypothetical protein
MMSEVGAAPMMHGWAKQMAGWWNRMVARRDGDMIKEIMRDSMDIACGRIDGVHARKVQQRWASALRAFLGAVGADCSALSPIPPSAIEAMHKSWQQFAWADSIMRLTKALPGVKCKHPLVLSGQRIELGFVRRCLNKVLVGCVS